MYKIVCSAFVVIVVVFAAVQTAFAGGTEDRVSVLEKQVATMQSTRINNNAEVASALSRMQAIQDEFTSVKGQAEASEMLVKRQYDELNKRLTDIDQRVQAIEDRLSIFSSQLTKALGKVAPQEAAEGEMYQKALDLASEGQYLEAASAFSAFVSKYPKSTFVPSAQYWVAECFYSMRDYRRAIKEYQDFIQKFPRNEKVAEATLKQGNGFFELGMPDDARVFYEKVISSYPRSAAAAQAQGQIARIEKRKADASAIPASGGLGSYPTETLEQKMQRSSGAPSDLAPEAPKQQKAPSNARNPAREF